MAQGPCAGGHRVVHKCAAGCQKVLFRGPLPRREHRRIDHRARSRAEPRAGDSAADVEEHDGAAGGLDRRLRHGDRGERRADVRAVRRGFRHAAPDHGGRRGGGDRHRELVEPHAGAAGALPGRTRACRRGGTRLARPRAAPRRIRPTGSRPAVVARDGDAVVHSDQVAGGAGAVCPPPKSSRAGFAVSLRSMA